MIDAKLKEMNLEELEARLIELQHDKFVLRSMNLTGKLSDTSKIRKNRREIARVCSLIASKKTAG